MAFPVSAFHYFNSPQIYEKSLSEAKQKIYFPRRQEDELQAINLLEKLRMQQQLQQLEQLEQSSN